VFRYNNHELSMRLDQQNLAKAAQKMEEIQARALLNFKDPVGTLLNPYGIVRTLLGPC
jgi:hypothetical protein